ncbi:MULTISPECIES: hypothetical protein [unclassified Shewanella]|uniref:hypothetical protein n=1 Tax=unclassified Shewanella TaxID=196818 RepID=UPI000CBED886|nr:MULTISPECIES: hypothetical protein [unclassified Shewanella]PIX70655.1 MAG: hypothetical protein COZ42_13715 [Shewanella sp. CG_4_10_14_3_um_filter_42_91]PIY63833.1 MAG: hypothetical protein COY92_19605 [Shewanella sp. CG_4_10_14_0_8_um_filter_42_13]
MLLHFKEIFPEFTQKTNIFFEDFKGEVLDKIFVQKCIQSIYGMQYEIFQTLGYEQTNKLSRIAIADLINLKSSPYINKETLCVINYLQLFLTFIPLNHLVMTGQHNRALKWINYSMCDDFA